MKSLIYSLLVSSTFIFRGLASFVACLDSLAGLTATSFVSYVIGERLGSALESFVTLELPAKLLALFSCAFSSGSLVVTAALLDSLCTCSILRTGLLSSLESSSCFFC